MLGGWCRALSLTTNAFEIDPEQGPSIPLPPMGVDSSRGDTEREVLAAGSRFEVVRSNR